MQASASVGRKSVACPRGARAHDTLPATCTAGVTVVHPDPRFDGFGHVHGSVAHRLPCAAARLCPDLRATPFADLVVSGVLGEGRRCIVFAAVHRDRQVVLKLYHSLAVAKHAQRTGGSLARYEYERNVALRGVPHLAPHVAEPITFFAFARCEVFVQEHVWGQPIDAFLRTSPATLCAFVLGEVRLILERAHEADLFDLDLHSKNILVRRSAFGVAQPVLFDFNKVPYHLQPPNPLATLLLKLGMLTPASRDDRHLRRLRRLADPLHVIPERRIP